MQYQTFAISAATGAGADDLNRFLRSHRVVSVEKRFVERDCPQWCFCIEYLDGASVETDKRGKIDYREVLSPEDFAVYAKLRDLRKTVAENGGVPVFAVFSNEQLAYMVRNRVSDKKALGEIPGVGSSKVEKYSEVFLERLKGCWETS